MHKIRTHHANTSSHKGLTNFILSRNNQEGAGVGIISGLTDILFFIIKSTYHAKQFSQFEIAFSAFTMYAKAGHSNTNYNSKYNYFGLGSLRNTFCRFAKVNSYLITTINQLEYISTRRGWEGGEGCMHLSKYYKSSPGYFSLSNLWPKKLKGEFKTHVLLFFNSQAVKVYHVKMLISGLLEDGHQLTRHEVPLWSMHVWASTRRVHMLKMF